MSSDNGWRGRFVRYAPLFLWVGVIFFLSSGQASMSNTSRIIRPLLEWLLPNASGETIVAYLILIRKTAHPTVYAVLGFLAARAFSASRKISINKYWLMVSLCTVFAVASIDETIQSFIASRTGSFYDVLLDTAGGITALALYFSYHNRRKNRRRDQTHTAEATEFS